MIEGKKGFGGKGNIMKNKLIVVRGGGDMASGTIYRLWQSGFSLVVLETEQPSAIRRSVSFSEAVYQQMATVEGLTAVLLSSCDQVESTLKQGNIPLFIDPKGLLIEKLRPEVVVDAILAKKNLGTNRGMAPCTIALGPGFQAGKDVDLVIETTRGHRLGRVISEGCALPNTGIPGEIKGVTAQRVLHAPWGGRFQNVAKIGDLVEEGEKIGIIHTEEGEKEVVATLSGVLRGLIRPDFLVTPGFKIADIDPRKEERENCFTISDKARAIGGGVLEGVSAHWNRN